MRATQFVVDSIGLRVDKRVSRQQGDDNVTIQYAIAKRAYDGESSLYVTSIKRCWSLIDNKRIWNDRITQEAWQVRKWATQEQAAKALANIADIGGYDDYAVVALGGAA